jgi:hypothetical protein
MRSADPSGYGGKERDGEVTCARRHPCDRRMCPRSSVSRCRHATFGKCTRQGDITDNALRAQPLPPAPGGVRPLSRLLPCLGGGSRVGTRFAGRSPSVAPSAFPRALAAANAARVADAVLTSSTRLIGLGAATWTNIIVRVMARNISPPPPSTWARPRCRLRSRSGGCPSRRPRSESRRGSWGLATRRRSRTAGRLGQGEPTRQRGGRHARVKILVT